jgi:hypothetical protein
MSKKEKTVIRVFHVKESKVESRINKTVSQVKNIAAQATPLTSEKIIFNNEEDLALLLNNEKEYRAALSRNQTIHTMLCMDKSWYSRSGKDLANLWLELKGKKDIEDDADEEDKDIVEDETSTDLEKKRLMRVQMDNLMKIKISYSDECDEIIEQMLREDPNVPLISLVSEQLRSQRETYGLLNLQIDYLKRKKRKERSELLKAHLALQKKNSEKPKENLESSEQAPLSQEKILKIEDEKPFGLKGWQVYWTNVRFRDNKNQLVELPTDSYKNFLDKLKEINAGGKRFQIKTASVASCIEMWNIPEIRRRALTSRFKYGPEYMRDWAKLLRGPVRILVKSDDVNKRLVFFAGDHDYAYDGLSWR